MKLKRILNLILVIFVLISASATVFADNNLTINCTLENGSTVKSSKKTFSVNLDNANNAKITATLNGENVRRLWSDSEKVSFVLNLEQEGKNTVLINAVSGNKKAEKRIEINYIKTPVGQISGQATVTVELFTLGGGYLTKPVKVDIVEGENSAQTLLKMLYLNGYTAFYSGTPESGFYLSYISDGTKTNKRYNGYKNSYSLYGTPKNPKAIDITAKVPNVIKDKLSDNVTYFNEDDCKSLNGYLGEFNFTNGSSFMYCINNDFANVSFSQNYLCDGDVMRIQYTLCYGADIGGSIENNRFYSTADKDKLTEYVAEYYSTSNDYKSAIDVLEKVNATQSEVDLAYKKLTEVKKEQNTQTTSRRKIISAEKIKQVTTKNKVKTSQKNKKATTANKSKAVQQNTKASKKQSKVKTTKTTIESVTNSNIMNTEKSEVNIANTTENHKPADNQNSYYILIFSAVFIILIILAVLYIKFKKQKEN